MPNNQTTNQSQVRQSQVSKTDGQAGASADRAREAAVTVVDLPVGTALSVVDRFNELTQPWRSRATAERELKNVRHQFGRELNRLERRGGTARRKAVRRVQRTRNRVEREVSQRRRRVETTVQQNRRKAERSLRNARTRVGV
jgi:hypothetical protein